MKHLMIAALAFSLPMVATAKDAPAKPKSPDELTCIYKNDVYTVGATVEVKSGKELVCVFKEKGFNNYSDFTGARWEQKK